MVVQNDSFDNLGAQNKKLDCVLIPKISSLNLKNFLLKRAIENKSMGKIEFQIFKADITYLLTFIVFSTMTGLICSTAFSFGYGLI